MPAQQVPHTMGLPDFKQMVLYTGNVMRTRLINRTKAHQKMSNTELIDAIDDTIKTSLQGQDAPSFRYFSDESLLEVPDLRHNSIISIDDRDEVEVTAKLFSTNGTLYPTDVDNSILLLQRLLGVSSIDSFVLSSSSPITANKTWKSLENYYTQGVINKLGVSDLSEQELISVLDNPEFEVKPSMNQVNYSCCDIPASMIKLAKQYGVDLVYTLDSKDILTKQELTQILQTTGVINTKKSMSPRWVLKYDVFVKNRSVVADKGYIITGDIEISPSS
ncbi:uncharacterized protein BX664DRAFT_327645 [Halteromyces radiatus]|uniref:uncharacterized protein n=1 Tax=Halteromyces radiatus TaxID=101107 RepID=UPI002220EEF2|nr:uncharacterized protein BX664DRAFT_327645 [Halteromyces radiatus]KAI8092587.1 hypothetical protein BX664DRAFT_327645 [Halteromyces radiatus]